MDTTPLPSDCCPINSNQVFVRPFPPQNVLPTLEEVEPRVNLYPRVSEIISPLTSGMESPLISMVNNSYSKKEREAFVLTLPTWVQTMLNQKFGKDNLNQCFRAETCLHHVLLPLFHSGFLEPDTDWKAFASACFYVEIMLALLDEYAAVDFRPLQGYPLGWESETQINVDHIRMATAAALHYDGDLATVVQFIGGPHVAAHRDIDKMMANLTGKIKDSTYSNLEHVFTQGVPSFCNAEASEHNFQAFWWYGNHSSVDEDPDKMYRAMLKDFKWSYCLLFDHRLVYFVLNCHLTPQGMVDLSKPYKSPHPIFDSSYHPEPWCHAINDWTDKSTEPPLFFASSFLNYLTWIWNLRITYPTQEIFLGDDDIGGAFHHNKYNPQLVAMHSYMARVDPSAPQAWFAHGYLACATGSTFGDNTSPSNFEPIANARQQLAWHLWHQPMTTTLVAPYLPLVELSPPPTPAEVATFVQADPDSQYTGVLDSQGNRKEPQYDHHVDDCMYGDVTEFMTKTVSASILSLYEILGYPKEYLPNSLSQDKLDTKYNHQWKTVGYLLDSRWLEVTILPYKWEQALEMLGQWMEKKTFTIREISSLHGTVESLTHFVAWAHVLFFGMQNVIRHELK